MTHYTIPDNLNLEEMVIVHPPAGIRKPKVDYLKFLITCILYGETLGGKKRKEYKGTPLNSKFLESFFYDYKQYLDYLEKQQIIKKSKSYQVGVKSKAYRVIWDYKGLLHERIVHPKLIKKIRDHENLPPDYLSKWFGEELSIDTNRAYGILNYKYRDFEDDEDCVVYSHRMVNSMEAGNYLLKRDQKSFRVHSIMTALSKEIRQGALRYKGEELVELDLKTSQPFFIASLLLKESFYSWDSDSAESTKGPVINLYLLIYLYTLYQHSLFYLPNYLIIPSISSSIYNTLSTHMFEKIENIFYIIYNTIYSNSIYNSNLNIYNNSTYRDYIETIERKEIQREIKKTEIMVDKLQAKLTGISSLLAKGDINNFKDLTLTGDLYQTIGHKLSTSERNKSKVAVLKTIYGVKSNSQSDEVLLSEFPSVFAVLDRLKSLSSFFPWHNPKKPHACVAVLLQFLEAFVFIDLIAPRVMRELPEAPVFTVHDCILTVRSYADQVREIIEDTIELIAGETPKINLTT